MLFPMRVPLTLSLPKPAKRIFSGPITHLLSVLRVLMKIFSHASAKNETKGLKEVKFRILIGRFH